MSDVKPVSWSDVDMSDVRPVSWSDLDMSDVRPVSWSDVDMFDRRLYPDLMWTCQMSDVKPVY